MNKRRKIITFALLTWLVTANAVVFAENLPQISSPFDIPAGSVGDSGNQGDDSSPPSLQLKSSTVGDNQDDDSIPSLQPKSSTALDEEADAGAAEAESNAVTDYSSPVLDDKKPVGKVVSASKSNTGSGQYSDVTDKVGAPKPKKMTKSGPEAAFLILPSLVFGYVYSRKRK